MSRYQPSTDRYLMALIFADADQRVPLPDPLHGGGPLAIGVTYRLIDNLGTAATSNITPVGPIDNSTTGTAISTAFGTATFTWDGSTYIQG